MQATGGHAVEGHTVEGYTAGSHAGAGHGVTGHDASGHEAARDSGQPVAGAPAAAITSCSGSCHEMMQAGTSCIPSAKAGALTVYPPHETGVAVHPGPAARTGPVIEHSHTPASPTPCDLSISRT
ncbi:MULTISPECIES: hypothetical protein [unclassified Arthrobacter]|uniref:hypothetical protein n=1 Tax=unclassified Arthrobacter TaxID=235627 RepID=UPI003399B5F8